MSNRKRYRKRRNCPVTAVQLNLTCDGFGYKKWGGTQTCKAADWVVNNGGDVYTVDNDYFRDHYQKTSPGVFEKIGEVWAEVALEPGSIPTKEGSTDYDPGDYLVFDRQKGGDGYAVRKHRFEKMYEQTDANTDLTAEELSYLNKRIKVKIADYGKEATVNRVLFYLLQTLTILAAALVPVLSGFMTEDTSGFKRLAALLGGISAVAAGILSLFRFQRKSITYDRACRDLESHVAQFNVGAGIYSDKNNAFHLLVQNCESIVNAERGREAQKSSQDGKPGKAVERQN